MTWQMFRVTYELRSPLHIGYHKIGNLQRTRYYIPARNVWGAVTEMLTRRGFQTNGAPEGAYGKIGDWVKTHCAFSYWFVCDEQENWLAPRGAEKGVCYGELAEPEFERRYLASQVTTALDAATTSAQAGSLHEVEFIAPHYTVKNGDQEKIERTKIGGRVFLDETAQPELGDEANWREWLGDVQIGGERRYGFGRLRLQKFVNAPDAKWILDGLRPRVQLETGAGWLEAHTLAQDVTARGQIEPLVGRETRDNTSQRFGMHVTPAQLCWAPGSCVTHSAELILTLTKTGLWQKAD